MKVLGLDIGGTTIKGAVCDGEEVLLQTKVPTNAQGGAPAILQAVFSLADKLLPLTDEASPVGVGSAGDIDPYSGEVLYATENLPGFTGLPLRALISQYTGREVTVVNDAVAGLIGEMKFGGAKGKRDVVMLTLGTGLGGGIAVGGKILIGSQCHGGRIGHIPLHRGGRACTCGKAGCAEQYVSATGLLKTAAECHTAARDCTEIFNRAQSGAPEAIRAVSLFLSDLSAVIETVLALFDPQVILLGGGGGRSEVVLVAAALRHIACQRKEICKAGSTRQSGGLFWQPGGGFERRIFLIFDFCRRQIRALFVQ